MPKQSEVEARGYHHFASHKAADLELERRCFQYLLEFTDPRSGLELFAGLGLFSSIIKERNLGQLPDPWYMWDHDPICVRELHQLHGANALVSQTDSFKTPMPEVEMVSADFNSFTWLKYKRNIDYTAVVDEVFEASTEWVQLTDSAVNKMHLNAPSYEKLFGKPIRTIDDYIDATAELVRDVYNFGLDRVAYHRNATYFLFKRGRAPMYRVRRIR